MTQLKLLKLGVGAYETELVMELQLVHETTNIHAVNLKELVALNGDVTEVLNIYNPNQVRFIMFCVIRF